MELKDKSALRIFKRLKCHEATESIEQYPEMERDDRSDLQFLADEISYWRSNFEEDGHAMRDSLEEARELLRETKNGERIPLNPQTMKPMPGYWPSDIKGAKGVIAEYKQLQYYEKRLAEMGYHGRWC